MLIHLHNSTLSKYNECDYFGLWTKLHYTKYAAQS